MCGTSVCRVTGQQGAICSSLGPLAHCERVTQEGSAKYWSRIDTCSIDKNMYTILLPFILYVLYECLNDCIKLSQIALLTFLL